MIPGRGYKVRGSQGLSRVSGGDPNIAVPNYYRTNDIITFYIKQEANKRVFTVTNPVKDKEVTGELNVLPLGKFKELNLGYD